MSNTRITVASLSARLDGIVEVLARQGEALTTIVDRLAQTSTPAPVVDLAEAREAKAAPAKATVKTVSLKTAQKRVDAGEDAWKIMVKSSNGNAVPFGLVLRAQNAQARKAGNATAPKAAKPSNKFFAMSKAQLLADGSKGAQAELERRAAKRSK